MINFKDAIKKYEPVLEIDDIETSIRSTEMNDVLDILHYMTKNIASSKVMQGHYQEKE